MTSIFLLCLFFLSVRGQDCPDEDPTLTPWNPGNDDTNDVTIAGGDRLLLVGSASMRTLTLTGNSLLVIEDGADIELRTSYISIMGGAELVVGSTACPYRSKLTITLWGRSDDDTPEVSGFGRKFIGIGPGGGIEIHGESKAAWSVLTEDLVAGSGDEDGEVVLQLAADVSSWRVGDRVVVASTDFSMDQAEEFDIVQCDDCRDSEIKVRGPVSFTHVGRVLGGVDMRAEVGLLTRNVVIRGELQDQCYGDNFCQYFDYDTFGGHTIVLQNFEKAIFDGIEMYNMGQQVLGRYPIHYHLVQDFQEYDAEAYVQSLSIHDCLSRCVTVHGTQGLTVEDVVGYNTLGHCFFLEDGNEERNTLRHNLGLVTKNGMLLPSDRDQNMCETYRDAIVGDYVPVAEKECQGASTFWIAHPNNVIEDNAAAGAADFGFFFIFHREPTGPSAGRLPPYHGERSPLGGFTNNRMHSNVRAGLLLDKGVKIDASSDEDPREFLAITEYARYMPHENQDPLAPRVDAMLVGLTVYKNNNAGAFVRGGDIKIVDSVFADNGIGLTMASDPTLPHDAGSHQCVRDSLFVRESPNRGNNGGGNLFWGVGLDGEERSLPQSQDFPYRGVELYDGPVWVRNSTFEGYWPVYGNSSALGFRFNNPGQSSPRQEARDLKFDDQSLKIWFGDEGPFFGDYNDDGDLTQIMRDLTGEVTGEPGAFLVRPSNWLARDEDCELVPESNAVLCTGKMFGQLHIKANTKDLHLTVTRDSAPSVTLAGATRNDLEFYPDTNIYMPVLQLADGFQYSLEWDDAAPSDITLMPLNFPQNTSALLALAYSGGTPQFSLTYEEWDQMRDEVTASQAVAAGGSVDDVAADEAGLTYFWDEDQGLLYMKVVNPYSMDMWGYCSTQGCSRWNIQASD